MTPPEAPDPTAPRSVAASLVRGLRAVARSHEIALVVAAAVVGLIAATCVTAMTEAAIRAHILIFDLPFDVRLSATDRVAPLAALAALTLGGLSLGLMEAFRLAKKIPGPVDPVEANALRPPANIRPMR